MPASPVFIIGAPRSGTSIMNQVLREALGYAGENEGHVFSVLKRLMEVVKRQDEFVERAFPPRPVTTYQHVTGKRLKDDLANLFKTYTEELYGDRPWQDKTPTHEMISFAPRLQEMFPSVRFIFMKRRGVENVLSGVRKFKHRTFEELCVSWARSMEIFANVQAKLNHVIVIDQAELVSDPQGVAQRLVEFLGLDDDAVSRIVNHLKQNFPERTHPARTHDVDLDETDWTDEQKLHFVDVCGAQMERWGYALHATSLRETKNLNKWCKVPKDPFEEPMTLHPNEPDAPQPEVRFLAMDFSGIQKLKLEAISNNKGPGAILEACVKADAFEYRMEELLAPGVKWSGFLEVPEDQTNGQLLLSVKLPDGCETSVSACVQFSEVKPIGRAKKPVDSPIA